MVLKHQLWYFKMRKVGCIFKVLSFTVPENTASVTLLEKLGLKNIGKFTI